MCGEAGSHGDTESVVFFICCFHHLLADQSHIALVYCYSGGIFLPTPHPLLPPSAPLGLLLIVASDHMWFHLGKQSQYLLQYPLVTLVLVMMSRLKKNIPMLGTTNQ